MRNFSVLRKIIVWLLLSFSIAATINSHAEIVYRQLRAPQPQVTTRYNYQVYNAKIINIYNTVVQSNAAITTRVAQASNVFLGKPYSRDPLGEGADAQFDQDPLYRTDVFDCLTYVETVIALAEANDLQQFKKIINNIRYHDGEVSYVARNHFISVGWNPNNQHNGYLHDVTTQFSVPYKIAKTTINIPNWYRYLPLSTLKMFQPISAEEAQNLLVELHDQSKQVVAIRSAMPYLPLDELFSYQSGQKVPNNAVFAEVPTASVIELVRPGWDLTKKIGTHLNVVHMGIALRTSQGLQFYEASSSKKAVIAIPLTQYLSRYYRSNSNAEFGINVEQILKI
jgi:hypothetical protein